MSYTPGTSGNVVRFFMITLICQRQTFRKIKLLEKNSPVIKIP